MELIKDMYTKERNTNIITLKVSSKPAMYWYRKPTFQNVKCTFIDGSVFYQRIITNDKTHSIKTEPNILYLDEACTIKADVTRKQKIQECKKLGLIKG